MYAWYINPHTLYLLHWPGGHRIQEHAFMFPEHHWNPLERRLLLWPPFGTCTSVGLSLLTSATRGHAGLGACRDNGSSIFLFKCESVVSMRAWFMCTIHFRAASRTCESKKNHLCAVAFSPVYSSFGSSGQHVSSSWRPSLLQYQWRKITPDSRSDLFWPRTGICVVRFRLPQLVAFITCFSQQGT